MQSLNSTIFPAVRPAPEPRSFVKKKKKMREEVDFNHLQLLGVQPSRGLATLALPLRRSQVHVCL